MNKKSQFGPDAIVGVVLVAIIGLGGVFVLNLFVNMVSLQGMITILDSEYDQKCFYSLNALQGNEYIRFGADVRNKKYFNDTLKYMGGYRTNMEYSLNFQQSMDDYSQTLEDSEFQVIKDIGGFISTDRRYGTEETLTEDALEGTVKSRCEIPVYSPVGTEGKAVLYITGD